MTKHELQFVGIMRFFTFLYAIGGAAFFIFHDLLTRILAIDSAPNRFWVVLSVSMMAILSYLSWYSSRRPKEISFVALHVLSKTVSVVGFLLACLIEQHGYFAYLVGAVTDFSVIVIIVFFFRRASASGQPASLS